MIHSLSNPYITVIPDKPVDLYALSEQNLYAVST